MQRAGRWRTLWADWRDPAMQRRVLALALPMLAANVTVPLVSLVDTVVAGHLARPEQLAAVVVGGMVYQVPVWVFGFLRMGTVGFAAQAAGREDGSALRGVLVQGLLLALVLALACVAALLAGMDLILGLMNPAPGLHDFASTYLLWRLPGLPASLVAMVLVGWFLGHQDAATPMAMLVTTNAVNVVLDLVFVLVLGWGVQGIALASALAAWAGLGVGLLRLPGRLARQPGRWPLQPLRRLAAWRTLLAVNRDILLRSLALQGVFFALTTLGTRLGTVVVAANALLLNGLLLTAFALDGLANAVEALTGHALGARDRQALRRALAVATGWSLVAAVLFTLLFAGAGGAFIDLQTSLPDVRQAARHYLPWLVALPVLALWGYLFDGLFIGATRSREMRDAMLVSALVFALVAWLARPLGNHGLWLAFLAFTVVRGGLMAAMAWSITQRGTWLKTR